MRLLLVRHGQTDQNLRRRFQGHADTPLNDRGRRQAAALAHALRGEAVSALYRSDLRRARETAQTIAAVVGVLPVDTPELRELDFGSWEGLTFDEARLRDPASAGLWADDPDANAPPDGETLAALDARARDFLRRAAEAHGGQVVVAVTHAGPIRVLVCAALGLPRGASWRFSAELGSLSELVFYPQGAVLTRLNVVPPDDLESKAPLAERTERGWVG